jgi:hypothetical protein
VQMSTAETSSIPPTRWLPELKQTPKRCGRDDSITVKEAACELLPARRSPVSPTSAPMLTADWRTDSRHRHSLLPVCYPISFRICTFLNSDEANFTHPILAKESTKRGKKELQRGDCGRPSE